MSTKRVVTAVIMALAVLLGGWLAISPRSSSPGASSVTARFTGFTNDAAGTRMAMFVISNGNAWTVTRRSPYTIQQPAEDKWAPLIEDWIRPGGSPLPAQASEMVTIVAPTNQPRWRVVFVSRKQRNAIFEAATELLLYGQELGLPTHYQRANESIDSDEIRE